MAPGEVTDAMLLLDSPYPASGSVVVINQTSQLVDATLRPVPLSEVYVHHWGSSGKFVQGSGAELRGARDRAPLKWPLAMVVDGESVIDTKFRMANIELINTIGVAKENLSACLECHCPDDPNRGSFLCCASRTCPTEAPPVSVDYFIEYNVTYRALGEQDKEVKPVDFFLFDVTGGVFEYQIVAPEGPNTTHSKVRHEVIDGACPQKKDFNIVRCTGHQHVGSKCISMYNEDTHELICRSCPVYGTEKGEPGNEDGYVVKMTDDDLATPYKIAPGTRVRLESLYQNDKRLLGAMGLMVVLVSDTAPCPSRGPYGVHGFPGYVSHETAIDGVVF
ncbi:hypothetical protein WJX81_003725 [Elliptochloris bilobata]|uniref:Uncharacterized protein n=1 Tax=Elliptochloris bilobata TaxID=381761 RepID=A0AAW1S8S5_9CHLO